MNNLAHKENYAFKFNDIAYEEMLEAASLLAKSTTATYGAKFIIPVEAAAFLVRENPNIGRNLDEEPLIQWIKVPNYNYKLFFVNIEEELEVIAIAVHHNNRDYLKLLPKLIARAKLDGLL
ncbi:MAG: hypothetical protein LBN08_01040 [Lactobacillales bacterium]|jgi:hypothetical protein|nr:hypothetical protein [Lactobacillales bacterium]